MSEINNDSVEAPVEKIEDLTPAVEEKPEVVETPVVEEKAVEAPVAEPVVEEKPKAKKTEKVAKPVAEEEKVVLFSERNVNWAGVGRLSVGYNLVSKADADKWLSGGSLKVRLATPEEVASKVAK
jgi:outer membrane biosynthesis protein TonB